MKLIAYGRTRAEAIERMRRAFDELVIEGIKTTVPLYRKIFEHPIFLSGRYSVKWLESFLESAKENGKTV